MKKLLILLVLVALTACSSFNPNNIDEEPVFTAEVKFTPTSTTTDSPGLNSQLISRCYKISHAPPPGVTGRLLLRRDLPNDGLDYFLLDLESGRQISLGDTSPYAISPDGSRLASWDNDKYIVFNSTGNKIIDIDSTDKQYFQVKWLDNLHLAFDFLRSNNEDIKFPLSLVVVDVESMEQREWFPEDFPQYYEGPVPISWTSPDSWLIINPDMNTMIYPSSETGDPAVLWDLERSEKIAQVYGGVHGGLPQWSITGEYFVVSSAPHVTIDGITYSNDADDVPYFGGLDLFLVSESGNVKRLTHFTAQKMATIDEYAWSPDGQKILFYWRPLGNSRPTPGSLSVIDVNTGNAIDYCMPGYSFWSPDGKYIVQALTKGVRGSEATIYIVDVATSQAWPIMENVAVLGWMSK